ncbi:DEAD/DEAH box helicase [Larsenimonas salina]|uniref:DEAD/DEAH box helicase n=1 Tax=Larsenimonas salina TaxID=1295565 RepID=UPI002072F6C4|nr:AAA domain-containing protein [Larsenimonas salina]MCM5705057.1 AAA domain-containing protein [Larsenimonas salina]
MSQAASEPSHAHAERILSFWHKVEFFVSPDLKDLQDGASSAIKYSHEELATRPDCLPWLNPEQLRRASSSHAPDKPYMFKLYLGVFPRREIFRIARDYYPERAENSEERNADEGQSCSMTVMVDEYGRIDPESFEFSTAPWALGEVMQKRLDAVTMQAFETATWHFQDRLTAIVTVADNVKRAHDLPPLLTTFELIEMLKAISSWTSFTACSSSAPALYIQPFEIWGDRAKSWEKAQRPPVTQERLDGLAEALPAAFESEIASRPAPPEPGESDQGREVDRSDEIAILNSFFIRDLERVTGALESDGLAPGSPLARYLSGKAQRHPDLLLPEGRSLLMTRLMPERMPAGRWPGGDDRSMSLMQQFAINTIDQELADGGLYSVNGPPGTGKTTMLRDLVARNVVKRADVLASLASPEAAFGEDLNAKVDDQMVSIKTLIPELAGFEMVVASSNNAAVENVTQELPQTEALGAAYRELAYLKPVGQKLAATHERREGDLHVDALSPKKECWGLIATALGNKSNRTTFGERVFFKPIDQCEAEGKAEHYRTLVPALKALAEKGGALEDFRAAQRAFNEAKKQVEAAHQDIARLQALKQLVRQTEEGRRRAEIDRRLASRVALWRGKRQAARVALWPIAAYCRHRAQLKQLAQRERRAAQQAEVSERRLASLEKRLNAESEACHTLETRYQDVLLPDEMLNLDAAEVQRTSFGHCKALNEARGQLTARAFELHQAWLVAAYADKKNQLWPTIGSVMKLLNGKVDDRAGAKALWQMLFMVVPVVSSTFASVANQFRMLGESDIGWLFIDEAGQAPPQQAVGALWRARRAVVVGDPLQIEPVFTVPAPLVEAMADTMLGDDWSIWSPTLTSVQVVADRANPYGTNEISDELWVGSPLRVHRRCDEPMFSIANRIAYNGKMLHGNEGLAAGPGDSRWFDIVGESEEKHFVPAQAAKVADMLKRHIDKTGELPSVYVISPFKAVARGVRKELETSLDASAFGGKSKLRSWLKARVGTVHTFQGKEEDSVILVLGLSNASPGAAEWASSKPNLLNVALTRAKKRVYVVGSADIWGSKQYFSEASEKLPS